MNIVGLSEATLEPIIAHGFIHELSDLFSLSAYKEEMKSWEGFGDKKVSNILAAIKEKEEIPFQNLLSSLGIVNVGHHVAKLFDTFAKKYPDIKKTTLFEKIWTKSPESIAFSEVSGIGEVIVKSIQEYFADDENMRIIDRLRANGLQFRAQAQEGETDRLAGLNFVISGTFAKHSRDQLKELIERHGGKNLSGVSANVDYLLAGQNIGPAKLAKASKLGIKQIGEDDFMRMLDENPTTETGNVSVQGTLF